MELSQTIIDPEIVTRNEVLVIELNEKWSASDYYNLFNGLKAIHYTGTFHSDPQFLNVLREMDVPTIGLLDSIPEQFARKRLILSKLQRKRLHQISQEHLNNPDYNKTTKSEHQILIDRIEERGSRAANFIEDMNFSVLSIEHSSPGKIKIKYRDLKRTLIVASLIYSFFPGKVTSALANFFNAYAGFLDAKTELVRSSLNQAKDTKTLSNTTAMWDDGYWRIKKLIDEQKVKEFTIEFDEDDPLAPS